MYAGIFGLGGPEVIALLCMGLCVGGVIAVVVLTSSLNTKNSNRLTALEEENRRLRDEIERLKEGE
jgi:hypothetical protein